MRITEMATTRSDAIETCINLSKKFVEHFKKGYAEGVTSPTFHHHCSEMQRWWNTVNHFVFRHNNRRISPSELIDWFFLGGSDIDTLFDGDTQKGQVYEEFMMEMMYHRDTSNVETVLYDILLRYGI